MQSKFRQSFPNEKYKERTLRKSNSAAARSRSRIVQSAAVRFRRNGVAATGILDIMSGAGFTHGGFYKHFSSKDQVFDEALELSIGELIGSLGSCQGRGSKDGGLGTVIDSYLAEAKRDDADACCPFAALGSELARLGSASRMIATDGLIRLCQLLSEGITAERSFDGRERALMLLCAMVGAMTMARITKGSKVSDDILRTARLHLHRIFDTSIT